jgi:hypothetical protein
MIEKTKKKAKQRAKQKDVSDLFKLFILLLHESKIIICFRFLQPVKRKDDSADQLNEGVLGSNPSGIIAKYKPV